LVRQDPTLDAFVVVGLGPQWVEEGAFVEMGDCAQTPTVAPVPSRLAVAGSPANRPFADPGSRLAFQVPRTTTSIPYTVESLLDWPSLLPVQPKPLVEPSPTETAIEAPWRLVMAPVVDTSTKPTWAHALRPVSHGSRTELWHTRLALPRPSDGRPDERQNAPLPTLRAVWTPDEVSPAAPFSAPFDQSIAPLQRVAISHLTSDPYHSSPPVPVIANRFMLSALGATVDLEGDWPDYKNFNLPTPIAAWKHRGTQGRDHYVRVVTPGFLFPLGHRAVKIDISERRFDTITIGGSKERGAFLHKRTYIVVLQAVRGYGAGTGQANDGRAWPFTTARLITLVTPTITTDIVGIPNPGPDPMHPNVFWPQVNPCPGNGAVDVQWGVVADDREGQRSQFAMPLLFVTDTAADQTNSINYYNTLLLDKTSRRSVEFGGQKVAYAPPSKPGSTTLPTLRFVFGADPPGGAALPGEASGFPMLSNADVHLDAAQTVAKQDLSASPPTIYHDSDYVNMGIDPTKGALFARLQGSVPLDFSTHTDTVGGLAAPSMAITGLSRDFGSVAGDLTALTKQQFDPLSFFQGQSPKIFGDVTLTDILGKPNFSPPLPDGTPDPKVPGLTTEVIKDGNGIPTAIKTTFHWMPMIIDKGIFVASENSMPATFELQTMTLTPIGQPGQTTSTITGDLHHFTIQLPATSPFIKLGFNHLGFTSVNGTKPSIDPKVSSVTFDGPLKFVNVLERYLASTGSGLSIDVQPRGVTAGFTIALPTLAIGVFSLQNMSFTAGLTIPFDGTPVLARFAFCSREHPFLLTVSLFGGGGFFSLSMSATKVAVLEISLEFGGNIAFDIVVASGGVHVMAGIYFKLDNTGTKPEVLLTGFVDIGGSLSVLGIITVSVDFYMALSYDSGPPPKAIGEATLTVSIEILFFSASVQLSVRKEFGGGGDPTFADMLGPGDWSNYCNAFAAA
jgi:hypothetical protein